MARPRHTRLAFRRAKALRDEMTVSEAYLWSGIRGGSTGGRFRRQVPIGIYIVDFACLDPKVVIEVDDPSHDYADESTRTSYLESLGFKVIRFTNHEVAADMPAAAYYVERVVSELKSK